MKDRMIRVLATHWEAETYTECWCETLESANHVAELLKRDRAAGDTTVQIDIGPSHPSKARTTQEPTS